MFVGISSLSATATRGRSVLVFFVSTSRFSRAQVRNIILLLYQKCTKRSLEIVPRLRNNKETNSSSWNFPVRRTSTSRVEFFYVCGSEERAKPMPSYRKQYYDITVIFILIPYRTAGDF